MNRLTCAPFMRGVAAFAGALFLAAAPARAQEQGGAEAEPEELMRQIRRNLVKIEDELQKVRGDAAKTASDDARKDMEKLIETLKRRQGQVTKDIDEIIRQMKASDCGGGGSCDKPSDKPSSSNSPSKKPGAKNRNQSEGEKSDSGQDPKDGQNEPKDGQDQASGKKPQGGKPEPKKDDKKGGKPGGGPENNAIKGGDKENKLAQDPTNPKARVVVKPEVNEIWGRLPKELRQKLVDRNFSDFTPEYEDEIREYLRRTNTVDK
jgi:hypothetical protein